MDINIRTKYHALHFDGLLYSKNYLFEFINYIYERLRDNLNLNSIKTYFCLYKDFFFRLESELLQVIYIYETYDLFREVVMRVPVPEK